MRLTFPVLGRVGPACFAVFLSATAVSLCRADGPATRPSGEIAGRIMAPSDVPLSEMVVYLESPDPARGIPTPKEVASISQRGATFAPALLVVCVGQTVAFLNDENQQIEHNVFSNAPAKRFDLGLYKPGECVPSSSIRPGRYSSTARFIATWTAWYSYLRRRSPVAWNLMGSIRFQVCRRGTGC